MSLADSIESLKKFDVNDLDFNKAGIWPAPIKGIVFAIVFGAVLFGGYWFFVKDLFVSLEREQKIEVDLKKTYEEKSYKVANLAIFKEQMAEMEQTFGALVKQLPSDTEVPGLLEDITNTAVGSGLTLKKVDLQAEIQRDFYVELPINIEVSGTYHELASFVSSVASLPRIVTLHDFEIGRSDNKKGASAEASSGSLTMTVVAKTYRYKAGG